MCVKDVLSFLLRRFVLPNSPRANPGPGGSCMSPTQPESSFRGCGHRKYSFATNRFSSGLLADSFQSWTMTLGLSQWQFHTVQLPGPSSHSLHVNRPWGREVTARAFTDLDGYSVKYGCGHMPYASAIRQPIQLFCFLVFFFHVYQELNQYTIYVFPICVLKYRISKWSENQLYYGQRP